MTRIEIMLANSNGVLNRLIGSEVNKRIGKVYTPYDETAILRQRDTKPEEFAEYNAFVENIKTEVKAEIEAVIGKGGIS